MSDLAVLVPTLRRPHRVAPVLAAIEQTTPGATVVYLPDPDDGPTLEALEAEGSRELNLLVDSEGGNYAAKINRGVALTTEPLVFTAADDLEPKAGWLDAAKAAMVEGVEVVGVNDLIRREREHATHFLLSRAYAERPTIDGGQGPFCTRYFHWWIDDEFIATAKHRGVYAYAPDAEILHLHPMAGLSEDDSTYQKARVRIAQDRRLFRARRRLWT